MHHQAPSFHMPAFLPRLSHLLHSMASSHYARLLLYQVWVISQLATGASKRSANQIEEASPVFASLAEQFAEVLRSEEE